MGDPSEQRLHVGEPIARGGDLCLPEPEVLVCAQAALPTSDLSPLGEG
jgi:hypothetical protein